MNPREGLRVVGKAAEYVTGLDVVKESFKIDDELYAMTHNKPFPEKVKLQLRGGMNFFYHAEKWVFVIPYRLTGLDLASRGVRKFTDKLKTDKPTSDN